MNLSKKSKPLCIDCGIQISGFEHKRCIVCVKTYQTGKNASNYKGVKYECIDCGKKLANIYSKRCQPCAKTGKRNNRFGKTPKHTKRINYNNIIFRSLWEANFAKWLDLSGIKWKYESKTFDLGDTTYTPDFYLPEFDCYIEIKGYWFLPSLKKFNKYCELYNNYTLVFDKKILKNMGIIK